MKMFMVYTKEGTQLGVPVYERNKNDANESLYESE